MAKKVQAQGMHRKADILGQSCLEGGAVRREELSGRAATKVVPSSVPLMTSVTKLGLPPFVRC